VLPPILIETARQFYDYRAKYEDDETEYRFDFSLPQHALDTITDVAIRAGQSVGTRGLCRVDIRLDEECRPWVLEVNTIPGMTDHSLVPKAAQHMGIRFESLCQRAIESCLAPQESSLQFALAGHPAVRPPFGPFIANSRNSESVRRR
jgi:D-alanine-D-alanine ligase